MELILPERRYLTSYKEAREEYLKHKVKEYEFLDADKSDIFEIIRNTRDGVDLPESYVSATYLWLVDQGEFIGEVSIRHKLTESLLRFGGNIGYGIRYSRWRQGYGTILLQQAIKYSFEVIGLDRVLITCSDSNAGSYRVIEKNGGILQDKIVNKINNMDRLTRRYWISCK
ncbi:MAG: GNAT family N-acetyltransferase [Muricomes sp.]